MRALQAWTSTHKRVTIATLGVLAIALLAAGGIAGARATDSPGFCRAACHEMAPYTNAWEAGPHAGVSCVACHVDDGAVARLRHKFVALGEVKAHFAGDYAFPMAETTEVPDERCIRCHASVMTDTPGFDHVAHAKQGPCQSCHSSVGHEVPSVALEAAGILSSSTAATASASSLVAVPGRGSRNIAGHVAETCSRCHDLAATGCAACHEADHQDAGPAAKSAACETCHRAGPRFAFTHPASTADTRCEGCHARPAKHREGTCSTCHSTVATWDFKHPGRSAECTGCHTRPAKHDNGKCTGCHKTGSSWAFRHPSSAKCGSCHPRPASHRGGACSTCHASRTRWSFSHPGAGSACTQCHTRPAGHSSGACATCHRTGGSWAFRHTGSSSCASCHRAPSGHYGSSCASCHSPSKDWDSARFSHPRIPGGEHSYRSFSCVKCHPNGKSSATCARCHDSASGPRDDDDDD